MLSAVAKDMKVEESVVSRRKGCDNENDVIIIRFVA